MFSSAFLLEIAVLKCFLSEEGREGGRQAGRKEGHHMTEHLDNKDKEGDPSQVLSLPPTQIPEVRTRDPSRH